jgi:hypothetical protein
MKKAKRRRRKKQRKTREKKINKRMTQTLKFNCEIS